VNPQRGNLNAEQTVLLSEVCKIIQGGRHKQSGNHFVSEGGYPAYGAGGLNGYIGFAEFDCEAVVLSSIGARCGKCFYTSGKWTSLANTQVILPDADRIHAKFLWHQLNDEHRWPRAGTGQPFIKPSDVKNHRVFAPPYREQELIAAILDKADAIRQRRQSSLLLVDEFLRSLFLSMFGDPQVNPKGWPIQPLQNGVLGFEGGKNFMPTETERRDGVRVLKVSAVTSGEYQPSQSKSFFQSEIVDPRHMVREGDLLISRANTAELVGAVAYVWSTSGKEMLPDKLWRFVWPEHRTLEPLFVLHLARSPYFRRELISRATGSSGSMKNIGKSKMLEIPIPFPPVELQKTFARAVSALQNLSGASKEALNQADHLFQSLQQSAFHGDLSR